MFADAFWPAFWAALIGVVLGAALGIPTGLYLNRRAEALGRRRDAEARRHKMQDAAKIIVPDFVSCLDVMEAIARCPSGSFVFTRAPMASWQLLREDVLQELGDVSLKADLVRAYETLEQLIDLNRMYAGYWFGLEAGLTDAEEVRQSLDKSLRENAAGMAHFGRPIVERLMSAAGID